MNDRRFIDTLNRITQEAKLTLPALAGGNPTAEFLDQWGRFLEVCLRNGVELSDPRWQRVTVKSDRPHTRFSLPSEGAEPNDADFRIGLQLLMGMLEDEDGTNAGSDPKKT